MKNKFKNYGLWVAIASLVGMILKDLGIGITPEHYDNYVNVILSTLIIAGIISNPSIGRGFKDKR